MFLVGQLAQSVEQGPEKPRVGSSILSLPTIFYLPINPLHYAKIKPMSLLCPIEKLGSHELVICDCESSKQAHSELFRFSDDAYLTADGTTEVFEAITGIVSSCNEALSGCPSKIQLVLVWENLLKVSLWKAVKPAAGDAFTLLKNSGVGPQELQPFKAADTNDLFPWLYYAKRFDVLRKVCHAAKKQMEGHLKDRSIRINCHLAAEDTKRIVASSL